MDWDGAYSYRNADWLVLRDGEGNMVKFDAIRCSVTVLCFRLITIMLYSCSLMKIYVAELIGRYRSASGLTQACRWQASLVPAMSQPLDPGGGCWSGS